MERSFSESETKVNGATVTFRKGGAGPNLVWLHGPLGETGWMRHHEELSRAFTLTSPDVPGYGRSDEGGTETVEDLAFWLHDFLDANEISRPILAGHSTGGWIAAKYAVNWPDSLESLILVGPAGLRAQGYFPPDVMSIQVPEQLTRYLFFHAESSHETLPDHEAASPAQLAEFYKNFGRTMRIAWDPFLYEPGLTRRLKYVTTPTLVVWGEKDRLISAEHSKLWQGGISNSNVEIIPEAGHYCHLDNLEYFTRTVIGSKGSS